MTAPTPSSDDDAATACDATDGEALDAADVAIVGGGPAGAAAALTLLRYTARRVVVIERTRYEGWRVGETLSPGVAQQLQYLDAADILAGQEHLPAYGTAAAWGSTRLVSHDFLYTARGTGWHLDRRRFDRALAARVVERGGVLLTDASVVTESRRDGEWHLAVRSDQARGLQTVAARFVIDASGRSAGFARRQGARRRIDEPLFGLVGLCSFPGGAPRNSFTVVESCSLGWWYSVPLAAGRMVLALMTDPDVIRRHRLQNLESWWSQARASAHTNHRLTGAVPDGPPCVHSAFSQVLQPLAGDGWVSAGDAAAAFDPLSSMGIGYALASGIQAARAVEAALTGECDGIAAYASSVAAHYAAYRVRQRQYYALEHRWTDSAFWARRRAAN